jgi:hypothetical protein
MLRRELFAVLKWFVLLLLPLTLGWKLAVRPADPGELGQIDKDAQRKVADFLVRQHFTIAVADKMEEGQPAVRATAGVCRILVAKSPAMGWDRDLIRRYATAEDQVFIVFRGGVYAEQPTWLTVSDSLWSRFRRELGFKAEASPILAVIAARNCEAERLPWHELGWYGGSRPQPNDVA